MKGNLLTLLITIFFALPSFAWLRPEVSDENAVAHAQVIVIGRIKENSLVRAAPEQHVSGGISTTATLQITEVLKGPFLLAELPIEISYGLTPVVGGEMRYRHPETGREYPDEHIAPGETKLYDTGNSRKSDFPFTGDINKDQIWLLRTNADGSTSVIHKLRIWDPEDIQPTSKKEILLALIARNGNRVESQTRAEQTGTGQTGTGQSVHTESKSEDSGKIQSESERLSR